MIMIIIIMSSFYSSIFILLSSQLEAGRKVRYQRIFCAPDDSSCRPKCDFHHDVVWFCWSFGFSSEIIIHVN